MKCQRGCQLAGRLFRPLLPLRQSGGPEYREQRVSADRLQRCGDQFDRLRKPQREVGRTPTLFVVGYVLNSRKDPLRDCYGTSRAALMICLQTEREPGPREVSA